MNQSTPQAEWQAAVYAYARHINDYVARGDACDWQGMGDPDDPPDLSHLLPDLLARLRAANAEGDEAAIARFRADWPPLYEVVAPLIGEDSQGFTALAWLPDGSLLVRTGASYEPGTVVRIDGLRATPMPGVDMFGLSPDQQWLALAGGGTIRVVRSDDLSPVAELPLPRGDEALPAPLAALTAANEDSLGLPQQLIPFDEGRRVVVVQTAGVFVCAEDGIQRLLPQPDDLEEQARGDERYPVYLDMAHAAVSPDGRWIACGHQDGMHCIFDAEGRAVCKIGPHDEYPHHAAFFDAGRRVALNACHFYNGTTIAVDVEAFGEIDTDFYEDHPAVRVIEAGARVYASTPVGAGIVLGGAYGYLYAVDADGNLMWKQHVGGTVSAMAVSADGRRLAVGSYSGTVHLIDLASDAANPEQVGLRAHPETRRWLFRKEEAGALAW